MLINFDLLSKKYRAHAVIDGEEIFVLLRGEDLGLPYLQQEKLERFEACEELQYFGSRYKVHPNPCYLVDQDNDEILGIVWKRNGAEVLAGGFLRN